MAYLPTLLTLSGMHLLMAMLPGPNTLVVGWLSAKRSRGAGLGAAAGVALASAAWVALTLWGIGSLLVEAGVLYRGLRLAGAAYLVVVGLRLLRSGLGPAGDPGRGVPALGGRNPFIAGFLTTASNPKSAVFWTSAFLVAVPPHAPGWVHAAIVAVVAGQSAAWYGAVALALSTGAARRRWLRVARWPDLAGGTLLTMLGLRLALEVRGEIATRSLP
ncbi:MAG: LysE family translocator [Amaricoccus sp.]